MSPTDNTPEIARPPLTELPPSSETWELGSFPVEARPEADATPLALSTIAAVADRGSGKAVGAGLLEAREPWEAIADLALKACHEPGFGSPRLPASLVVDRPELVPLLNDRFQGAPVRLVLEDEVPMADALAVECLEAIASLGDPSGNYEDAGIPPAVAGELFDAARAFYEAAPWQIFAQAALCEMHLPWRDDPIYALLMGETAPGRGFALFEDEDALLDTFGEPGEPTGSAITLTFLPSADAPEKLIEEARQHGWKWAGDRAFPVALRATPTEGAAPAEIRLIDREEAELLVPAARAIAAFCSRHRRQLRNGGTLRGAEAVRTASGESVVIRLRVTPSDELAEADWVDADEPAPDAAAGTGSRHFYGIEELRELASRVPGCRSTLRRLQWSFFRAEAPFYAGEADARIQEAFFRFMEWAIFAAPIPPDDRTLAQRGIDLPPGLSSAERRRLHTIAQVRYGAFEVEQVERDVGLVIRDLGTDETLEVRERLATRQLEPGDFLLGPVFPDAAGRFVLSAALTSFSGRERGPGSQPPKLGSSGLEFGLGIEEVVFGATTAWIQEIETPHELRKAYESFVAALGGKASGLPSLGMLQKRLRQADSPVEILEALQLEFWNIEEAKLFAGFLQRVWNMTPRPELGERSPEQVHRQGPRGGPPGGGSRAGKSKKRRRR